MIRWLKSKPRPAYAVIYDSWNEAEQLWQDDMYEIFMSPEEAYEIFNQAFGAPPQNRFVANPRLVQILNPIPGQWGDINTDPTEDTAP